MWFFERRRDEGVAHLLRKTIGAYFFFLLVQFLNVDTVSDVVLDNLDLVTENELFVLNLLLYQLALLLVLTQ